MKVYTLNESEMRRLVEIEFMFDVLVGDDPVQFVSFVRNLYRCERPCSLWL